MTAKWRGTACRPTRSPPTAGKRHPPTTRTRSPLRRFRRVAAVESRAVGSRDARSPSATGIDGRVHRSDQSRRDRTSPDGGVHAHRPGHPDCREAVRPPAREYRQSRGTRTATRTPILTPDRAARIRAARVCPTGPPVPPVRCSSPSTPAADGSPIVAGCGWSSVSKNPRDEVRGKDDRSEQDESCPKGRVFPDASVRAFLMGFTDGALGRWCLPWGIQCYGHTSTISQSYPFCSAPEPWSALHGRPGNGRRSSVDGYWS